MGKPIANLRMFVGLYPPPEAAATLAGLLDGLDLPAHRRTPVEQLHMTAHFIGDVPLAEVDGVVESVERSASGLEGFELGPQRLVSLPQRGPARLVAVETDAPATLMELHRRLVHRLATSPRQRADERFLPHITLCRFGSPAAGLHIDQAVTAGPWRIDRVRLMRSILRAEGAEHLLVAELALSGV